MTKKKAKKKSGRLQKGEKKGRQQQRVKKYKRKQQEKKKGKKPKKYQKKRGKFLYASTRLKNNLDSKHIVKPGLLTKTKS